MKKLIIFFIIIILGYSIIFVYDYYTRSSTMFQKNVDSDIFLKQTKYDLNDTINILLSFSKKDKNGKNVRIKFSPLEENSFSFALGQKSFLNDRYKMIYKNEFWSDKTITEKKLVNFSVRNPKGIQQNYDSLYLNDSKQYFITLDFKFLKKNNKYILELNNKQIELDKNPYYFLHPYFQEAIFSSGDYMYCLDKYLYMNVEHNTLHIEVSEYDNACDKLSYKVVSD